MKNKRSFLTAILVITLILLAGCSSGKTVPENKGILGTWYESVGCEISVMIFYDDGTYIYTFEEYLNDENQDYVDYTFDEKTGILEGEMLDYPAKVQLDTDSMTYSIEEYDESHTLYRDRETAIANDPTYYTTDEFTDTIMDSDGFCIKDGVLYAYRGDATEVTVPNTVTVIYHEAFAGDYNHGINLEKVTVPGNVKEIKSNAFAFTNADYIYIEEGVEIIGDNAFMDTYMDEVHFPSTLNDIGHSILETEEGLDGTLIYVPRDSKIHKYFEENMPYGDATLLVQ